MGQCAGLRLLLRAAEQWPRAGARPRGAVETARAAAVAALVLYIDGAAIVAGCVVGLVEFSGSPRNVRPNRRIEMRLRLRTLMLL